MKGRRKGNWRKKRARLVEVGKEESGGVKTRSTNTG